MENTPDRGRHVSLGKRGGGRASLDPVERGPSTGLCLVFTVIRDAGPQPRGLLEALWLHCWAGSPTSVSPGSFQGRLPTSHGPWPHSASPKQHASAVFRQHTHEQGQVVPLLE